MGAKKNRRKKKAEPQPSTPSKVIPQTKDSMKRAHSIENETLETATTASKDNTPRNSAKRKNVASETECPNLTTARFWAEKAEALSNPLEFSNTFGGPAPFKIDYDGTIRPSSPQELFKYEGATSVAPLPNDAIATILKETEPHCPKAQTWIRAYEACVSTRGCLEARIADRDNLRRQVARKMRDRARKVANTCSASKQETNAFPAQLPKEDGEEPNDGKNDEMNSMREQLERVSLAHERLQKAIEAFRPSSGGKV